MEEKKLYVDFYVNEGDHYNTKLTKNYSEKEKWQPFDEKKVVAIIPGTIREIYVQSGQTVRKGENIMILEAMKMKNRIRAPFDGKIKSVKVKENQVVSKNFLLIEME